MAKAQSKEAAPAPVNARFAVGDKVAWTHGLGAIYGHGSVIRKDAAIGLDQSAKFGEVTKVANDKGTHFDVKFEGGETLTLTEDELIKISE